jgi:hypothetical protein
VGVPITLSTIGGCLNFNSRHQTTQSRVHGFGGRWLVNGSGRGILSIQLITVQRAYVMGLPVQLRELLVSVRDWPALAAAFKHST